MPVRWQDVAAAGIVALTGWGQDRDRERTLAAGFDRHLVKPLDLLDLQDMVTVAADRIRTTTTTVREVP